MQVLVKTSRILGTVQVNGVTQVLVDGFKTFGKVQVGGTGVVGAGGVAKASLPNCAKGFGRPSLPSGIKGTLESCKLLKATSEKTASFSFIFLTFNKSAKKSLATTEVGLSASPVAPVLSKLGSEALEVETKFSSFGDDLMKKM